jgi:hypothetical protein
MLLTLVRRLLERSEAVSPAAHIAKHRDPAREAHSVVAFAQFTGTGEQSGEFRRVDRRPWNGWRWRALCIADRFPKEESMGFFSRLMGVESEADRQPASTTRRSGLASPVDSEQQALERYRYMLRTAPPETLEQAHAEAFAKLTSEQRRRLLSELAESAPAAERGAIAATAVDDTQALARVATRAEVRQPGILERTMGSGGMGLGANLLSSFAMGFVGSMVAQSFFSALGGFDGAAPDAAEANAAEPSDDESELADDGDGFDDGGDMGDFDV